MTVSCGKANFSGSSGAASGGKKEETTEQPTEVSGGFGLTCVPGDNPSDAGKVDVGCTLANSKGEKFQERPDLSLDLKVTLLDQVIPVSTQPASAPNSFTFSAPKSDISNVFVSAKLVQPKDPSIVLSDLSRRLPRTIAPIIDKPSGSYSGSLIPKIDQSIVKDANLRDFRYTMIGENLTCTTGGTVTIRPPVVTIPVGNITLSAITCDTAGVPSPAVTAVYTLTDDPNQCGGPNNSCYAPQNLVNGAVKTITGTTEKIQYTETGKGFGYWKSSNSGPGRYLNFTGFWDPAKKLGWQMKLKPDGKTFDDTKYFEDSDAYRPIGVACPGRVFNGVDDEGETGRCIYYYTNGGWEKLKSYGGVPSKRDKKWFSFNHPMCAAWGMRLPTLYELYAFTQDNTMDQWLPSNVSNIRSARGGSGIQQPTLLFTNILTATTATTATVGTTSAPPCSVDGSCFAGVVNGKVSTNVAIDFDASLYCVLH